MKKWAALLIVIGLSQAAMLPAYARNVKYMLPISATLADPEVAAKLDGSVKLFFGPQPTPAVQHKYATMTSHGRGLVQQKADLAGCKYAFAEALQDLQKNAKGGGANAIVNITSSFKNGPITSSATEVECHAGSTFGYVTLTGDIVKIADK